jgi:alpha-tubulin suppressor-like RCC1 family protein
MIKTGIIKALSLCCVPPGTEASFRAIATGWAHTCVILTKGDVLCWGLNDQGQLGIGNTTSTKTPSAVSLGTGMFFKEVLVSKDLFNWLISQERMPQS